MGFATRSTNNYLRTSNGGETWEIIIGPFIWFNDMVFIDSLTGYKSNGFMMKTIDGGLSWIQQSLPNDTNFFNPDAVRFSKVKDTIWAVGANIFAPGKESSFQTRGILYFTSNGGLNWGYQIPDTSYGYSDFF
ncbi:MAG: hypothetical protein IPL53_14715 [Ignavibacteria bacterium]|nr:hypothetical protein [Ignavibacteria bacterium]